MQLSEYLASESVSDLLHNLCAHCIFPHKRSMRYQPIFHTLYFTLQRARILNNVVLTSLKGLKYWMEELV